MSVTMLLAAASMMANIASKRPIDYDPVRTYKEPIKKDFKDDVFTPSHESFKIKGYANMVLYQALEHLNYKCNER